MKNAGFPPKRYDDLDRVRVLGADGQALFSEVVQRVGAKVTMVLAKALVQHLDLRNQTTRRESLLAHLMSNGKYKNVWFPAILNIEFSFVLDWLKWTSKGRQKRYTSHSAFELGLGRQSSPINGNICQLKDFSYTFGCIDIFKSKSLMKKYKSF